MGIPIRRAYPWARGEISRDISRPTTKSLESLEAFVILVLDTYGTLVHQLTLCVKGRRLVSRLRRAVESYTEYELSEIPWLCGGY